MDLSHDIPPTVATLSTALEELTQRFTQQETERARERETAVAARNKDREVFEAELKAQKKATEAAIKAAADAAAALTTTQAGSSNSEPSTAAPATPVEPRLKTKEPAPFNPANKDVPVRTWIFTMDSYFKVMGSRIRDKQKIDFAVTLLAGPALQWSRQMLQRQQEPGFNRARRGMHSRREGQKRPTCRPPTSFKQHGRSSAPPSQRVFKPSTPAKPRAYA